MLTYGDCFSGMSCPAYALKQLGIEFEYKFACDINRTSRKFLETEHNPEIIYDDACTVTELPKVDLFIAGFPCQPYSTANSRLKDAKDHKSFDLFDQAMRWINMCDPEIFILENVRGLTFKNNKSYFENILTKLRSIDGYHFDYKIMDSKDYGSKMRRDRIWFIGKKSAPVVWPKPWVTDGSVWDILDLELPIPPFDTKSKNWSIQKKIDELKEDTYIDNGQSTGAFWRLYDRTTKFSYCIVSSHSPSLYRFLDGQAFRRWFTDDEIKQLFGLKTEIKGDYGKQIPKLLGNGMDINLLEQLIKAVL